MGNEKIFFCGLLLSSALLTVFADSNFAGASVSSDSSGTRSVLVSGRNGAAGVGILSPRIGGGGVSVGSGFGGTYASAGPGGASASAGPTGAYAGAGGAYAGPGPWGYPYPDYYDDSYYGVNRYVGGGSGAGVYSSSDTNGISTRFASVGPGGQATIIEQRGNEPPRVYNYRGAKSDPVDFDN